jgi:hypothetical protein
MHVWFNSTYHRSVVHASVHARMQCCRAVNKTCTRICSLQINIELYISRYFRQQLRTESERAQSRFFSRSAAWVLALKVIWQLSLNSRLGKPRAPNHEHTCAVFARSKPSASPPQALRNAPLVSHITANNRSLFKKTTLSTVLHQLKLTEIVDMI